MAYATNTDINEEVENESTVENPINEDSSTSNTPILLQSVTGSGSVDGVVYDLEDEASHDPGSYPSVIRNLLGNYEPRTYEVTTYLSDGTTVTSTQVVPGINGIDWSYLGGLMLFMLTLFCALKFVGVIFKCQK